MQRAASMGPVSKASRFQPLQDEETFHGRRHDRNHGHDGLRHVERRYRRDADHHDDLDDAQQRFRLDWRNEHRLDGHGHDIFDRDDRQRWHGYDRYDGHHWNRRHDS